MFNLARRDMILGGAALSLLPPFALPDLAAATRREERTLPPPIGREERVARIAKAQRLMRDHEIGAILVEAGPSLDYFTGVRWGRSERLTAAFIPAQGDIVLVTPFFEKPSVEESLGIEAIVRPWHEHEEPLAIVAAEMARQMPGMRRIGMEETNRFWIADRLKGVAPHLDIVSANPVVRGCRMIKTPAELALIEAANLMTLEAIREVHGAIKAGMTGGDVSAMLGKAMRDRGGSSPWALVLVNEASALPHGTKAPQVIQRGSVVLIDTGCALQGYQADISRTFVFDADPSAEVRKVWNQVARGRDIAMKAATVGATAGSVDDAVRAAYESWGYGPDYALPGMSHRTGHGIGMEGHEPVNFVRGELTRLQPGMCFSNEPGLYFPGKFGVRLEDIITITETGARWFTGPPKSIDEPI